MKTFRVALIFGLLAAAGTASAQINMPTPGSPGSSPDSAIRIVSTSDLMLDRQISRWLRTHYPGWDADPIQFMEFGDERFAVVYISSSNNPSRRVYFRIQNRQFDPTDDDGPNPFPL